MWFAEATQSSLQSLALPLFNLLLKNREKFHHIVGPLHSISSTETHQRVVNLLPSELISLPALQIGKNLTNFLSFHWSIQLAEVTANNFNGMSLCLFYPFHPNGSVHVFSSSVEMGVALNTLANVCDSFIGVDSQFYISCFAPIVAILMKQSQLSLSYVNIDVLVEFFNRLMNNKFCLLFHNSTVNITPEVFGQQIMDVFVIDVFQKRLELSIIVSPAQFNNSNSVTNQKKKRGVGFVSKDEENKHKNPKKINPLLLPIVAAAGVKKGSIYCVNHMAKLLSIPGAKGCVLKAGVICNRKHIPLPVPGQHLDAAIKMDLKTGVNSFAAPFKNPFLLALDSL
jgi:hypothetical protein